MALKAVSTLDAFLRHPLARMHVGSTYVAWCASPHLVGMTSFGHRTAEQAAEVARVFSVMLHPRLQAPINVLLDYSRMEGITPEAFQHLAAYLSQMSGPFTERLGKVVMLVGPTQVGASLAGTAAVTGYAPRLISVDSTARALEALGSVEAPSALDDVDQQLAQQAGKGDPVNALRGRLRSSPAGARLEALATDLGVSPRTLQRALTAAGTTFLKEVHAARVAFAAHALKHGDDKVEHIARAVGCSSASQLAGLFRRHTGMTPAEYRARNTTGA